MWIDGIHYRLSYMSVFIGPVDRYSSCMYLQEVDRWRTLSASAPLPEPESAVCKCQKRPTIEAKETALAYTRGLSRIWGMHQCQKRPGIQAIHVPIWTDILVQAKETNYQIWLKRLVIEAKETWYRGKRDLLPAMTKETYNRGKRDLLPGMTKETWYRDKRGLLPGMTKET